MIRRARPVSDNCFQVFQCIASRDWYVTEHHHRTGGRITTKVGTRAAAQTHIDHNRPQHDANHHPAPDGRGAWRG